MIYKKTVATHSEKTFLQRHGKFLGYLVLSIGLMLVASHVFAHTTTGSDDLKDVAAKTKDEVNGYFIQILAWITLAIGLVGAVTKMNIRVVLIIFGIFIVLLEGPGLVDKMFSAII